MGVRLHLARPPGSGAVVGRRRRFGPLGSLGSGSRTRNGPDGVEAERCAALVARRADARGLTACLVDEQERWTRFDRSPAVAPREQCRDAREKVAALLGQDIL